MAPQPAALALRVECAGSVREETLTQLEAALSAHPAAVDLRFAHACILDELGRLERARSAYALVLELEPGHFGALLNLGTMRYLAGDLKEARALYEAAADRHPNEPSAFINLGNALADTDSAAAEAAYERARALDPAHPAASFALALLHDARGDAVAAARYRASAFAQPIVHVARYRGAERPVRVLLLLAANGGNIVTTLLFDDRTFEVTSLIVESAAPGRQLPAHEVLFNGIADADRSDDALERAASFAAATGEPVVNPPAAVRRTGRAESVRRLSSLAGVVAPRTERFAREAIAAALEARGFHFPLLLRAPGYHMGAHFELVPSAAELPAVLAHLPGNELFVIDYVDARGADGNARKYRALFVDGAIYPVHLAIAPYWKVHYFSADMRANAANRAEEAAFLEDPRSIGPRAYGALEQIAAVLGLDYGGVDFGLDAAGNVIVFEANASMALYLPDGDERFVYRRPAIERILAAVHSMVLNRARLSPRA